MLQVLFIFILSVFSFVLLQTINSKKKLLKQNSELAKQCADLQRILKFRGNLASEIAHEIKNPITAILCSAETLDMILADKLDESQRLTLRYIKDYGDNLHKLVSDFLDLSRSESGNMECNMQKLDLEKIIQSVTGLLEAIATRKGVILENVTMGKNISVLADPIHLKQILFNLIHNSIKYTEKNGKVIVNCTSSAEDGKLLISVEDSGKGIAPEKLSLLFDPYVKFENLLPETVIITESGVPQQGTGIGLAICKSLVELHGGKIMVHSVPGKGSVFSFTMTEALNIKSDVGIHNQDKVKSVIQALYPTDL